MTEQQTANARHEFTRLGLIGCGTMGAGVAELAARAGCEVLVRVGSAASEAAGRGRITASMDRAVAKGKITKPERDEQLERISFTTRIEDLADRPLVIEAVREEEPLKAEVLSRVAEVLADERAVLATNTSSLPISRLAGCTRRPEQVIGIHFFNPAHVMPLVELVPSLLTGADTVARAESFVRDVLGKTVIQAQDRAGFLVNSLLFPYLLSAIRLVEAGTAAETVDAGMTLGCSHPLGPLRLADLIGLDVTASIARAMHEETGEPLHAPPPLLLRMVDCGLLGRKSGRGFYSYA
ncbi:3-hydroxybutyryl-CoA dehydrogenase [Streptomyces hoynatensis]|uniref:3-hydroxybutyryl-CoA dehydrogenase n=1 Tax=Streptomyces hoynatensis TaxID=1141874 RepID=A0A3A9ZIG2_9ACTN|nr:3-hydroxybutyryl-CoA dehydrogenase [Streptomyces hoynatensis]RKN47036.1 3-hydroxybutyryl-CoA dehydrogenase [Streptomyces hoynatensis]